MRQLGLLPCVTLFPRLQYDAFFQHLPLLSLQANGRGRPALSIDALLKEQENLQKKQLKLELD
jgi:hypothetical protein